MGLVGCRKIGAMATASTPVALRVLRLAASQTRDFPVWSVQDILLSCVHFASEAERGEMLLTLGACLVDILIVRAWVSCLEARRNCRELPRREDGCRSGGMYLDMLLFPVERFNIWMLKEVVIID